jgi:hypothetical protein
MTFTCVDLKEAASRLEHAGVPHTKPVFEPWGSYISATDSDGRTFLVNDRASRQ